MALQQALRLSHANGRRQEYGAATSIASKSYKSQKAKGIGVPRRESRSQCRGGAGGSSATEPLESSDVASQPMCPDEPFFPCLQ